MSELIDREKLIIDLIDSKNEHAQNSREESLLDRDIRIVKEQPKADGKVHGHWIEHDEDAGDASDFRPECSVCGERSHMDDGLYGYILSDFCPNCGACMDEDTEREDDPGISR